MIVDAAAAAAGTSAFGSLMPGLEFHSSRSKLLLPQLKQCWQAIQILCTLKASHDSYSKNVSINMMFIGPRLSESLALPHRLGMPYWHYC